ncbi:MAG TPA: VOC family protein [Ramlibacter sp.]|nr:VOC family protein [Ramlibacter sp.]
MQSQVDHLVIAAASLDQGISWCRDTFGFEPTSGGEHPLMGTHNRVFRVDSPAFPRAYFEIIAINPAAADPGRTRWFDLDDAAMREQLQAGPKLVHFVASTTDAAAALRALQDQGIDRGALVAAERPTASGVLRWKISVRADGQRLFDGALPTLIEWGEVHPCDNLPASRVTLASLEVSHPQAPKLRMACDTLGLRNVQVHDAPVNIAATFDTPRGTVRLSSARA